jgi:hypothetical protein
VRGKKWCEGGGQDGTDPSTKRLNPTDKKRNISQGRATRFGPAVNVLQTTQEARKSPEAARRPSKS